MSVGDGGDGSCTGHGRESLLRGRGDAATVPCSTTCTWSSAASDATTGVDDVDTASSEREGGADEGAEAGLAEAASETDSTDDVTRLGGSMFGRDLK